MIQEIGLCNEAHHIIIDNNKSIKVYDYVDIYYIYKNKIIEIYGNLVYGVNNFSKDAFLIRKISVYDNGFAQGSFDITTITFTTNKDNGHITDILELEVYIQYVISDEFLELFSKYFCKNITCSGCLIRRQKKYKEKINALQLSLHKSKIKYNTKVLHDIYEYL